MKYAYAIQYAIHRRTAVGYGSTGRGERGEGRGERKARTKAGDDTGVVGAGEVALAGAAGLGAVAGDVGVGGAQEAEGQDEGADLEAHVGRLWEWIGGVLSERKRERAG